MQKDQTTSRVVLSGLIAALILLAFVILFALITR